MSGRTIGEIEHEAEHDRNEIHGRAGRAQASARDRRDHDQAHELNDVEARH